VIVSQIVALSSFSDYDDAVNSQHSLNSTHWFAGISDAVNARARASHLNKFTPPTLVRRIIVSDCLISLGNFSSPYLQIHAVVHIDVKTVHRVD